MTVTETPAETAEAPLIAWKDNGVGSGECGFVGDIKEWLVQIWRPSSNAVWELILNLPGLTVQYGKVGDDMDAMKEKAEEHVRRFIADLTQGNG